MVSRKFQVVVADPPWPFRDRLPGGGRGAEKYYPLMNLSQIASFVPDGNFRIADDSVLLLWRVATMQPEAIIVCRSWGFEPRGELVWQKLSPKGRPFFGMGRMLRGSHESVLIGVRGKPRVRAHNVRSIFTAVAGRHSEKPDEFYELVEQLFRGPYLELFARRQREGWTCLGNEVSG